MNCKIATSSSTVGRTSSIKSLAFIYGLLALSIVIAVFGIVLTLLLAVYERRHETGLLRAVGMTRAQVRATVRWESVLTSVYGAAVGVVMGLVVGYVVIVAVARPGADEVLRTCAHDRRHPRDRLRRRRRRCGRAGMASDETRHPRSDRHRMNLVEMSEEMLTFLAERHLATLTTLRADGSPHVVPVGFSFDVEPGLVRVITFAGSVEGAQRSSRWSCRRSARWTVRGGQRSKAWFGSPMIPSPWRSRSPAMPLGIGNRGSGPIGSPSRLVSTR